MKIFPPLAFLLSIIAWVLLLMTFASLLSGSLDTRSCQTDCVKMYYFGAGGSSLLASLFAVITLFSARPARLAGWSLIIVLPVLAIVVGIFLIGTFGHLLY